MNAEATLAITVSGNRDASSIELVSIVTRTSADNLGLRQGKEVFTVIKSSSVMIAAG